MLSPSDYLHASRCILRPSDVVGECVIVAVPSSGIRGVAAHLCTVYVRVGNSTGRGVLTGTVRRMVQPGVALTATDVGAQGRSFVAGNVSFEVVQSGRRYARRRDVNMYAHPLPVAAPLATHAIHVAVGTAETSASMPAKAHLGHSAQRVRRQSGGNCSGSGSGGPRPLGDTNGDCVFDVVDVGYLSESVLPPCTVS